VENRPANASPLSPEGKYYLLLTGDLHGRLSPAAEARLAGLRQGKQNTLLLDAGDAIQASNLGGGRAGQPILERMHRAGYDAMAMGNRESHPFRKVLEKKLEEARFPILAANIMAKRQPLPAGVKSHIIPTLAGGLRLAIIGLAPQITAPESWWSRVTDYIFDDPLKTARGLAAKLRDQADLVIILSHCGLDIDRQLAKVKEIDLILGGHSHQQIFERGDGAPILHSGSGGNCYGVAEVTVICGKIATLEGSLQPLSSPPPCPKGN
jgi:2',3'-cyclic-nucleotide 2'-phosphodiesterase (5'-nucleotidase family)